MCKMPEEFAADAHGMGQEGAVADIARWLDLRAAHRAGAARAEALAVADLLRTGDWLSELEELSKS
jgi:hypothetical protein